MTIYNKTSLKSFFEQGDVPTGTNYADFIDSNLNLAETAVQAIAGPINPTEVITARVSAGNGVFTGDVRIDGILSAANFSTPSLSVNTINSTGDINCSAASVYASAGRFASGIYQGSVVISALGTTQATAAPLVSIINRGKGVVDGSSTGYGLLSNRTGLVQYLYNEGASANLWPVPGGTINGLAVNAAFSVAASSTYTILHVTASSYAVK